MDWSRVGRPVPSKPARRGSSGSGAFRAADRGIREASDHYGRVAFDDGRPRPSNWASDAEREVSDEAERPGCQRTDAAVLRVRPWLANEAFTGGRGRGVQSRWLLAQGQEVAGL